jgi:uncharacterized protein
MGMTVVFGDFEWDVDKAEDNLQKHGISFEEAVAVFADDAAVFDLDDASGEERLTVVGAIIAGVVYVVFVERGVRDRIISAREATRLETSLYRARRMS